MKLRNFVTKFSLPIVAVILGFTLTTGPARGEEKKVSEPEKKTEITMPKLDLGVTDEFIKFMPLEEAKKVMIAKLFDFTIKYDVAMMKQLHLEMNRSPLTANRLKTKIAGLVDAGKTTADILPSVLFPPYAKRLENFYQKFKSSNESLENDIKAKASALIDPQSARIDELKTRLEILEQKSQPRVDKNFVKSAVEIFKNPAMLILLVLQIALGLFVAFNSRQR